LEINQEHANDQSANDYLKHERKWEKTNHERCLVDHSGAARAAFSVCWWNEVNPADRSLDVDGIAQSGAPARIINSLHRPMRSAWRAPPDSSRTPAHSAEPDIAGRGWIGNHHDRDDSGEL